MAVRTKSSREKATSVTPGFIRGKGKANGDPNGNAGGPSLYSETHVERVYRLCLLGLTNKELSLSFGVEEQTIYNWREKFPDFAEAIKKGRMEADSHIAQALYHRAKGYSHKETVFHTVNGELIQNEVIRHYPPDTTACRIWLKNRTKRNDFVWTDSFQAEVSGKDGGPIKTEQTLKHEIDIDFSQLTEDELKMCAAIGMKIAQPKEANPKD